MTNVLETPIVIDEEELNNRAKREFGCYILDENGHYIYQEDDDIPGEYDQAIKDFKAGYRSAINIINSKIKNI